MLIGLNGRKQAGKDTVYQRASQILADVLPVERVSFADLLYESAAAAIGVTPEILRALKEDTACRVQVVTDEHDGPRVRVSLTFREYLQRYGTEAHRDVFGANFWTTQVDLSHEGRLVMVTDCRFPNEAHAIHDAGGIVVEVIGPMGRATADTHASEAPLPKELIDATITNTARDDGYRALDAQVDTLLRMVLRVDTHSVRA